MERWRRYLLILSTITFLGTFCFAGLRPLISVYAFYALHCDYGEIGIIGGATGLFFSLTSFPFGKLSDWKGRKKVILIGGIGLALTPLLIFFSSNFFQILIFSAALGIFIGAWFPVTGAIAADVSLKRGDTMSIYSITISAAYTIAFFISFFLLDIFISNFFIVFLFLSLIAATATFIIIICLKGEKKTPGYTSFISLSSLKTDDIVCKSSLGAFTYGFFIGAIFVLFPVYAKSLAISYTGIGIILMAFSLVRTFTYVGMSKIMRRMRKEWLMMIGLSGCGTSAFMIFLFHNFYHLLTAFSLLGLAIGVLYLSALTIAACAERKGRAIGAYEAALGIGTFISPLICGFLAKKDPSYPYLTCAILAISILLMIYHKWGLSIANSKGGATEDC
ncbi:MAG: MFS transporter [Candidatus Methanospirareceae archaeon]